MSHELYWGVVRTEPRREHVARQHLMRERYQTYLPRIYQRGRVQPLFPAYIFVLFENQQWYRARWSIAVRSVLMDGERPAQLADDIVESIRGREVNGLIVLPRAPRLRPGQKVRVVRGSFQDRIGIYDHMVGIDRECILLNLLGRQVQVTLAGRDVVGAEPAK
jgi:transcriptional antiterminator RfaH